MFKHPLHSKTNSPDGLQRIQLNLNSQRLLTNQVKAILPQQLALHCLHVVHANNKIVLFTDSSAWASKLLFMRQTILKHLSTLTKKPIKNFKVKVLAKTSNQIYRKQRLPKKPSTQTIYGLSISSHLEQNDALSIALKKLADTL